ncbi:formiminotransferase cyclodeaminase [Thermoplasma volcanium GSS1]|uniref:Formiminotransferase cyclodeaminase n=1 Tax=Thermoplasma volcanium (strain ATCC 51530 / DSM 4299 / JCM 9571 / NBRC 15438 / GSS1) TaxID=273116 RepID=Q97CL2_THEVO|nr:cyclodeaminase/cyclohydrolase family protein [Thermoplasma volcanium]BAB59231.1 formiminotransferase cyclodeaminase [Thermoplasma volcanium GSS1]
MESYNNFIERLASPSPAPGGGAASAFVSIVASALISMVSQITMGKKGYEQYEDEMKEIISENSKIKEELEKLIEEDEEAFNSIMAAIKMPKITEEEKKEREKKLQSALRHGIEVPWRIAARSFDLLKLSEKLVEHGNKNAVTDAGSAASILHSAIEAALYNVKINLKSVKDQEYVSDQKMKIKLFLENSDEVYERIKKKLEAML